MAMIPRLAILLSWSWGGVLGFWLLCNASRAAAELAAAAAEHRRHALRRSGLRRSGVLRSPPHRNAASRSPGSRRRAAHGLLFGGSGLFTFPRRAVDGSQPESGGRLRLDSAGRRRPPRRSPGGPHAACRSHDPATSETGRLRHVPGRQVALQQQIQCSATATAGRSRFRSLVRHPEQRRAVAPRSSQLRAQRHAGRAARGLQLPARRRRGRGLARRADRGRPGAAVLCVRCISRAA